MSRTSRSERQELEELRRIVHLQAERIKTLERVAVTDPLTGLLNRRGMKRMIARKVERATRNHTRTRGVGLLMIDVNDMKRMNDTYGHKLVDEALARLGKLIRRKLRPNDRAFRIGGDEVLIVLDDADFVGTTLVASRIADGVKRMRIFNGAGQRVLVGVSIGGVSQSGKGLDGHRLYLEADIQMYLAKRLRGKERCPVSVIDIMNAPCK